MLPPSPPMNRSWSKVEVVPSSGTIPPPYSFDINFNHLFVSLATSTSSACLNTSARTCSIESPSPIFSTTPSVIPRQDGLCFSYAPSTSGSHSYLYPEQKSTLNLLGMGILPYYFDHKLSRCCPSKIAKAIKVAGDDVT